MNQPDHPLETLTRRKFRWRYLILIVLIAGAGGWRLDQSRLDRRVEERIETIKRKKLPVTLAELNEWYPAAVVQENAALNLNEACSELQTDNKITQLRLPGPGESLTPELRAQLTAMLGKNESALARAHEAVKLPHSRFPLDLSFGYELLLPHLAKLKALTLLFAAETLLAADDGAVDRGVQCVLDGFSLAHSLAAEPILVSQMVRQACVQITVASLERLMTRCVLSANQLQTLRAALAQAETDDRSGMVRGLVGERSMGVAAFRMPPSRVANFLEVAAGAEAGVATVFLGLRDMTGLKQRDLLFYLETMEEFIRAAELDYQEGLTHIRMIDERLASAGSRRKFFLISFSVLPSLRGALTKTGDSRARLRSAQTAIAVELFRCRHRGELPSDLRELVPEYFTAVPQDPLTGTAFRMARRKDGYHISNSDANVSQGTEDQNDRERDDLPRGSLSDQNSSGITKPRRIVFVVGR